MRAPTPPGNATSSTGIDVLRDESGGFSMLAIDQRGSLRSMLSAARPRASVDDETVIGFKVQVARWLSPGASAILVDRPLGLRAARAATAPVILAADVLGASQPGGIVDTAELDGEITDDVIAGFGAVALKMLVPWTPTTREQAVDLSSRFMDLCRRVELPGIVEGVIRPLDISSWPDDERDAALVDAAGDLGATGPDLYKAEVPSYGEADPASMAGVARQITARLTCPWVVLSSGVAADRFPGSVAACRDGGASGFLAGRALWADAVTAEDPETFLRTVSVGRLQRLAAQ